ncbi:hypothetical protein EVAR_82919_1 [Eumeta japonica]|uniref:Uncharacterized protein n=1 Tax=Eumeta variegata TaxID=151549 RepID=A0A4C1X4H9_EUMVA|nr:hypothetical protein EVAR_82919_1 [Eumeta japonica]
MIEHCRRHSELESDRRAHKDPDTVKVAGDHRGLPALEPRELPSGGAGALKECAEVGRRTITRSLRAFERSLPACPPRRVDVS